MLTVTLFFPEGELVSRLAANNKGKEFVDWVCIDGPGSGNLKENLLWTRSKEYPMPLGQLLGLGWNQNEKTLH
ncbi:hypothetical protein [Piscirickettsia litoralis]|nr:hypothetical protein [Piscirickettsia litoralis]